MKGSRVRLVINGGKKRFLNERLREEMVSKKDLYTDSRIKRGARNSGFKFAMQPAAVSHTHPSPTCRGCSSDFGVFTRERAWGLRTCWLCGAIKISERVCACAPWFRSTCTTTILLRLRIMMIRESLTMTMIVRRGCLFSFSFAPPNSL